MWLWIKSLGKGCRGFCFAICLAQTAFIYCLVTEKIVITQSNNCALYYMHPVEKEEKKEGSATS